MDTVPTASLIAIVIALIALAGLIAGSETALMSVNRHRLRHQARLGNRSARLAQQLLEEPDRLIGVILLCNTIVTVAAASLTSLIALRLGGEPIVALAAGILTIVLLIFGEIAPKTYGALYPERLALPAVWIYAFLVRALYPLVWIGNRIAHGLLRVLGVSSNMTGSHSMGAEELRTLVAESSTVIPQRHRRMLASILDLERTRVDDIMIPRNEIANIDISDDWDSILEVLRSTPHTRLPVCDGNLDNIVGILHMKKVAHALARGELDRARLLDLVREREAYFVPEGTTLNTQLANFQRDRRRIALVVDEYGDIQGLVTLEDILEEIVGEFTSDPATLHMDIHREPDGAYVVSGAISVRALNRATGWSLPTEGPRTLNGAILEYLENSPDPGTSLRLGQLSVEILQTADNAVKTARIRPIPIEEPQRLSKGAA